jgi:putative hydrolase of the HAD superfamily
MPEVKAIVFDLDDTLYSEQNYVLSGFKCVADWAAKNLNIDPITGYAGLVDLYSQGVRQNTFNQWLILNGVYQDDLVSILVMVYREHLPSIKPFSESVAFLRQLSNYKIGLVSDGYLEVQKKKWVALNLESFFDAVVFSDRLGRENWKPSKLPFEVVLRELDVLPINSIYIGDNPIKDFFGARKLGMYTIQVKRSESEYCELLPPTSQHSPDLIVSSFLEIVEFMGI